MNQENRNQQSVIPYKVLKIIPTLGIRKWEEGKKKNKRKIKE